MATWPAIRAALDGEETEAARGPVSRARLHCQQPPNCAVFLVRGQDRLDRYEGLLGAPLRQSWLLGRLCWDKQGWVRLGG